MTRYAVVIHVEAADPREALTVAADLAMSEDGLASGMGPGGDVQVLEVPRQSVEDRDPAPAPTIGHS